MKDKIEEGVKILYITDIENREKIRFELSDQVVPFYENECKLDLGMNDVRFEERTGGGFYSAYPTYVSMEDLKIIFPNCSSIKLECSKSFDFSELAVFTNLDTLDIRLYAQLNLNGIEFLFSLRNLCIHAEMYNELDLTPLNSLELTSLDLSIPNTLVSNLKIETLEKLDISDMWYIESFENVELPNLKLVSLGKSQYGLLTSLKVPDGCEINMYEYDDVNIYTVQNIVRKMFPNLIVKDWKN
jgi:hypothetical protein